MNYTLFENQGKKIFLVDMKREESKIFSELVMKGITKYLNQNKKIAIIVNKKGYSSGVMCTDCGYLPKCDNCDVPVSYHLDQGGEYFGICHICKKTYNQYHSCPNCGGYNIRPYGIGTQKIAELILETRNKKSLIIESETVNSPKKIQKIFDDIYKHQIVIGTSLLTNPIKSVNFDLIIFVNADLGLNIPDYNANQGNFLFLYETFTKQKTQNYIVQSFNPDNYSIINACRMDINSFRKTELKHRLDFGYPPYKELAVIMYKNDIEEKLFNKVNTLYQELIFLKEKSDITDLEIFSTPPMIYKIFGKYRYNIILKSSKLREFMDKTFVDLQIYERGFKLDREPTNIV